MNQLEQLKDYTTVVADTGDFESIKAFAPQDATTNPSLIFNAVEMEQYAPLLDQAIDRAKSKGVAQEGLLAAVMNELLVGFGLEILKIVPGRVSTEVDARLSFDKEGTLKIARELIALYEENGVSRDRVLIKIASTWEGIEAAKELEAEGIHCNLTLLFSLCQAIACAEGNIQLISPFVGRILDWYKASTGQDYQGDQDPGVISVKEIYNYYKKFGYKTEVMGASFRNTSEIVELAGCDLLTIGPALLEQLQASEEPITCQLNEDSAKSAEIEKINMDEKTFRWMLNEDAMATEKLAEGIRKFGIDIDKLEAIVAAKLA